MQQADGLLLQRPIKFWLIVAWGNLTKCAPTPSGGLADPFTRDSTVINFHKRYYCDKPFHSTMIAIKILLLLLISKFEIILWLVVASGHDAQCTPTPSYSTYYGINDQNLVDFHKLRSLGSDGTWSQRRLVRGGVSKHLHLATDGCGQWTVDKPHGQQNLHLATDGRGF